MIPTVDSNILVYAIDQRDSAKHRLASDLIDAVRAKQGFLALQACGEFYRAATRRLKQPPQLASEAARFWLRTFPIFPASIPSTERALIEVAKGRLSFWDANLLSAAEMAGCTHIFSEDMADGLKLGGLEVVNPFGAAELSDRALQVLGGRS